MMTVAILILGICPGNQKEFAWTTPRSVVTKLGRIQGTIRKKKVVILKLDFEKAFDKIEQAMLQILQSKTQGG
jgi:hypothetical protein